MTYRNLIGGNWQHPTGRGGVELFDPATELPVPPCPVSSVEDVAKAVSAARASGWQAATRPRRLAALRHLYDALEARRAELAALIAREIGAPPAFADAGHVAAALGHLAAYAAALEAAPEELTPWGDPAHRVRFEPLGAAALITPWNWPLNQVALKVGGALAAGCPMVLKPSELTPASAVLFAGILREVMSRAEAPGAFNLILGDGRVGAALVRQPDIAVVSFTGSTGVGREIGAAAGHALKTVLLELGGKSANILFADCDVAKAVTQGVAHCFRNGGQSCNAAARMIVERPVYDQVVEAAGAAADAHVMGETIGPIITARQFARVQGLIEAGLSDGARLIAGGLGRARLPGLFPKPTVFADVTPEMAIWRQEVFGPVLTITPFDTEEEAVALAQDSAYGLAGYVQTADPARADRVARALEVGMVQVNGSSRAPGAPFGGVKASGLGREGGIWGIRAFQFMKSISGAPLSDGAF